MGAGQTSSFSLRRKEATQEFQSLGIDDPIYDLSHKNATRLFERHNYGQIFDARGSVGNTA